MNNQEITAAFVDGKELHPFPIFDILTGLGSLGSKLDTILCTEDVDKRVVDIVVDRLKGHDYKVMIIDDLVCDSVEFLETPEVEHKNTAFWAQQQAKKSFKRGKK